MLIKLYEPLVGEVKQIQEGYKPIECLRAGRKTGIDRIKGGRFLPFRGLKRFFNIGGIKIGGNRAKTPLDDYFHVLQQRQDSTRQEGQF